MMIKPLIAGLVGLAVFASPTVAGTKSMKNTSTAANSCKSMMKAKKVSKADWKAEMDKCLDNPTTYQ